MQFRIVAMLAVVLWTLSTSRPGWAQSEASSKEPSPAAQAAERLPLDVCPAPWGDEEILCGSFEVLENRDLGSGRRISLNLVIIPALAEKPEPDPIFDLDGGPGLPATKGAEFYARFAPFRQSRDIVLVDLRGMGASNPLHCDLRTDSTSLQGFLDEMYPVERVRRCREELEETADLTQYHTENAMADLEEIRAWLGYESINVMAVSYGARAAYVYARRHPQRVRSMIFIGPADIDSKLPMDHAPLAERAFVRLCEDCETDPSCNAAFPDLETKLRSVVDRLRSDPAVVSYAHPQMDSPQEVSIRAEVFVESLRSLLYDAWSRRDLPWIVEHAHDGDFGPFLDRAIPRDLAAAPLLAEGAYLSITGTEDAPFIDAGEADALAKDTLLGSYRVDQQRRAAGLWPAGTLPADYFEDVVLDVPVLVLQGDLDPVVEPGRAVTRFRRGRELIVPHMAHLPSGPECVMEMMATFFDDPDPAAIDAGCLAELTLLPFRVSAEE